ncbi:MAG TPA: YihY/virulence factor BrkB family protein [Iamia sp.]|nr:YihY/virulence factor BrkB family protein [Iamia sp.]
MTATHRPHGDTAAAPGRDATAPQEIPARGWLAILRRTRVEAKRDDLPLLAAGVAFYALLSLVPALAAMVSVYGLVADPADVDRQVGDALAAAPAEVRELVSEQLRAVTDQSQGGLGLTVAIGVLLALWSASSGMKHLIGAINVAYDEEETRGFVALRLRALLLTLGAIVFAVVAVGLLALAPGGIVAALVRIPLLGLGMLVGLAVLYRYGPDRDEPRWSWTAPGTIVAVVGWLVGSALFSLYTATSGSYAETYGALGAVVVLMLWLMISAAVIVVGAEVNAEAERQTARDSTVGEERPLGTRDAHAADTVAG